MPDAFRLPTHVAPTRYRLRIEPDLTAGTFEGAVRIDVEVAEPCREVRLHALGLDITTARVDGADARVEPDPDTESLCLTPPAPLAAGPATLELGFGGSLGDRLVGFYRSTYSDDDGEHVLGVTQFEATHARQAFPCFDEPAFKAVFEVTLVVDPDDLAISNGAEVGRRTQPDGRVEVDFAPTIPMSTYLVAWVVGRLVATDPVDVDGVPVRVVCRPGMESQTATALDVAAHSLRWFRAYYGIDYPGDKCDLVAVPDFGFGAMENLGCITFREILLLMDPERLTQLELERAATVIAHEIAHMWFGDLVTMRWWDGIWLNEAFATFMELSCADAYRPDWKVWNTFGQSRAQALATDATGATRPIEFEVRTPAEATAMFDVLTYEKGAGVLRMVEQFLGPDRFRDGIRDYLHRHRLGNTETSDLWAALDAAADVPVSEMMSTWIHQGGHPLLEATEVAPGRIRLEQQPFRYAGDGEGAWMVPVGLRGRGRGAEMGARVLLGDGGTEVHLGDGPEWWVANADGVGFYRCAYDDGAFARLAAATGELTPLERFGLLDDAWALLLAGVGGLDRVVTMLRSLGSDDDPAVLRRVLTALGELRLLGGPDHDGATTAFARAVVADRADDEPELAALTMRIRGLAGADAATRAEATALLDRPGGQALAHAEQWAAAIDVAAAAGGAERFEEFVAGFRAAASPQDELRQLTALTRFESPELQDRLFELCRSEVRTQNTPYVLAHAMANPQLGGRAWRFVRGEWDGLVATFPENSVSRMVGGVRSLWDPEAAADAVAFLGQVDIPVGAREVAQHVEMVRVHQATRARVLDGLEDALAG